MTMINTDALKKKILDLAIHGKLVPQDPNDEPAEELLKRIKSERDKLIDEGKIKGKKEDFSYIYKGDDNRYYEKKLGLLCKSIGTTDCEIKTKNTLPKGKYPVISQSLNFIDGYTNTDKKPINNVPVIVFGDHTRIVKYIDFPFFPGADGTKIIFSEKLYSKYFYYLVLYASLIIENRGYGRHFALLKATNVPVFENINLQKYISSLLDFLFHKIDEISKDEKDIEKLKSIIKNKIIRLGLNGKLLSSDDNSYYEKSLKNYRLGDVLQYEQPTKYIVKTENYSEDYQIPVLTAGKSFILGKTNEKEGIYEASKEPVIIFDDFTTSHHLVNFDFKVKSSAMKILKNSDSNKFDIVYLEYLLTTIKINASTHKRYWISIYSLYQIKIPCLDIQNKIVKDLHSILDSLKLI